MGGGQQIVLLSTILITPLKKSLQKTLLLEAKKLYTYACGVITSEWGGRGVYPSNTSLAMDKTFVLRELYLSFNTSPRCKGFLASPKSPPALTLNATLAV